MLEATRARAEELGISERIHWLGQITDVVTLLKNSHIYVLATRAEGLPVAVLEAMALGLPVVGTRASGMGEAVLDGETGLLVDLEPDASRAARLGDAIEVLARDPALAARMGAQSAERARTAFSPRRLAAETAAVYREALGRRP